MATDLASPPACPPLLGQPPAPKDDSASQQAARSKRERLLEIYTKDAAGYTIYRDASRKEKVELQREPVYVWTNPVREGGQDGAVFVWTCRGRAEVLGTFFSFPATGPRDLCHEFHSLSLSVLDVSRTGANTWTPEAPGIELTPIADAPAPARSAPQRLAQMRALTHDFSASTKDHKETTLGAAPAPSAALSLQEHRPRRPRRRAVRLRHFGGDRPRGTPGPRGTQAGGTDATRSGNTPSPGSRTWTSGCGTRARRSIPPRLIPYGLPQQDPKHRYRVFSDRYIPAVEDRGPDETSSVTDDEPCLMQSRLTHDYAELRTPSVTERSCSGLPVCSRAWSCWLAGADRWPAPRNPSRSLA